MKYIIITLSLTVTIPAANAGNFCTGRVEIECGKTAGCSWRTAETWTRGDGKVRNVNAGCKFDVKAAKAALAKTAQ